MSFYVEALLMWAIFSIVMVSLTVWLIEEDKREKRDRSPHRRG